MQDIIPITKNNIHLVDIIAKLVNEPVGVIYNDNIPSYVIISSMLDVSDDVLLEANKLQDELILEQENVQKISEAKDFLLSTDHKFYNGYKPKDGEDLVALELQRDEAREFIRNNKV